jgi:hypothetical protein
MGMRWWSLLVSLLGLACGNADASWTSSSDPAVQTRPMMSSRELEQELDDGEREIAGDGGRH